jgi:hypothetical protein
MKGPSPTRDGEPFDRLSADLQAVRLEFDMQNWEKFDPAQATPAAEPVMAEGISAGVRGDGCGQGSPARRLACDRVVQ